MKNKKLNLYDLSIPNDYNLKSIGITQGLLYTWTDCRIKFLLAINRLRLKKSPVNTMFGTLFHAGLETMYKTNVKSFTEMFNLMKNSVIDEIEKEQRNLNSLTIEEELWDKWLISCSIMFPKYFEFYKKEILRIKSNKNILEVEEIFEANFNCNYKRVGKIDLIFKDIRGDIWIEDHKTKSRIDLFNMQQVLSIDLQGLFYCTSIENLKLIEIKGFIHDIIRKPEIKIGESILVFKSKLKNKIEKDPSHYFKKIKCVYSDTEKRLFNSDVKKKIVDIELFLNNKLHWYKNQTSCMKTFPCDHLNLCLNSSGYLINYKKIETFFPELEDKNEN